MPAVGVNSDGNGEVFRLNLEVGRFMKGYEIDVGGDDFTSMGGGALQGGIDTGSVNTAAIAEESHNLLAFGTSLGTVEFWDPRSRSRAGILAPPPSATAFDARTEITALEFDRSGLTLASGTSTGLIHLYDLRSPLPLLKKDQGYGFPIQTLKFLNPTTTTRQQTSDPKILSADKRIIKLWDPLTGAPWTSVEPAVDINHVEWIADSGMILTANEGKALHSFLIPQLGPAPRWCAFLDNLVEEMAEDGEDPAAFSGGISGAGARKAGEVYDNYKFLTLPELRALSLDHLVGTTGLLKPYMHGFFVQQRLYEEARLISNPELWQERRAKSIQEKIEKERESRIRGSKKVAVKVNRRLAEKMAEREEKSERRRARRILERGRDGDMVDEARLVKAVDATAAEEQDAEEEAPRKANPLTDSRFARLFQDEDFEVDETSREFQSINPSTNPSASFPKGLTAVEQEQLDGRRSSDSDDSSDDDDESRPQQLPQQPTQSTDKNRLSSSNYRKSGHRSQRPQMLVSSSTSSKPQQRRDRSFGSRAASLKDNGKRGPAGSRGAAVGEKEVTFAPARVEKAGRSRGNEYAGGGGQKHERKDRRSASGNVFRRM